MVTDDRLGAGSGLRGARVRAHVGARDLALALAHARALTDNLALTVVRDLDLDCDHLSHSHSRDLAVLLRQIQGKAHRIANELAAVSEPAAAEARSRPAGMARWTTGWAARILPVAHRARWQQEYASELAELAAQGATRRQQFDYGVQVLFNAFSLRRAVRRPVAQRAKEG